MQLFNQFSHFPVNFEGGSSAVDLAYTTTELTVMNIANTPGKAGESSYKAYM